MICPENSALFQRSFRYLLKIYKNSGNSTDLNVVVTLQFFVFRKLALDAIKDCSPLRSVILYQAKDKSKLKSMMCPKINFITHHQRWARTFSFSPIAFRAAKITFHTSRYRTICKSKCHKLFNPIFIRKYTHFLRSLLKFCQYGLKD